MRLSMRVELLHECARHEQRLDFGEHPSATMSATTSAATGRCFGIQRVCQAGSARARRSTRGGRGHTTGWARGRRGGGRRRGNRTRSCWRRFGPISRGPRSTAKAIARSTHGFGSWTGSASPARGCCRHAGARTALPAPRASGRREDPRREGHHPGAQRDVGDGRRAGIHARRRVGLDLRGSRTHAVGWHVCKVGSRFAALDPIAQGLERLYGSLDADVARGLAGWITVVSTCHQPLRFLWYRIVRRSDVRHHTTEDDTRWGITDRGVSVHFNGFLKVEFQGTYGSPPTPVSSGRERMNAATHSDLWSSLDRTGRREAVRALRGRSTAWSGRRRRARSMSYAIGRHSMLRACSYRYMEHAY